MNSVTIDAIATHLINLTVWCDTTPELLADSLIGIAWSEEEAGKIKEEIKKIKSKKR